MKGQFFKSYFIVSELGEGGFSKVYLAFDLKSMQFCAIKFLHQSIQTNEMWTKRLRREVEIYKALNHKNVVNLVEDALDQSPPYMALEFLRGTPLNQLLKKKGRLPGGQSLQILEDITEALHATHRAGIIHRDLQPANIILTYMGWCKVFDYGIAYRKDGLVETEPGSIMGTVIYCSPEQNMGMKVEPRSDMYSLGLILFEMLTGQRALEGTSLEEIRMSQMDDLEPPSAIVSDVHPALDQLCELLTQRAADDRLENATKLLIELGKLRAGGDESIEAKLITDPAERRLLAARRAFFEEKWEFVDNICARMQDKKEGGSLITFYRAKALSKLGKHDLAFKNYEKAIFQDPENIDYLVDYAVALITQHNYPKAKQVLQKVPVGSSDTATVLVGGLLQLLALKDKWPPPEDPAKNAPRTSFIGRLFDRLKG